MRDVCTTGRKSALVARCSTGALLLLLIGACSGGRHVVNLPDTPPPGIEFGAEITLISAATEKVAVQMTQDGRLHVIAITEAGDALHVVISERGIEERNKVGSDRHDYYENLSMASDADDRIHLALKDKYWIWDEGGWRLIGTNRCALLARAGDSVACITEVSGKELGTAAQWGVTGFGGGPAGVIVPYRIRPAKIVVAEAARDGWSYRNVVDYQLGYSVNLSNPGDAVASGDAAGRLHLFFKTQEDNRFGFRYASVSFSAEAERSIEWRPPDRQAVQLINADSEAIGLRDWFIPAGPPLPFAVDPQTGTALFFARKDTGFGKWVDAGVEIRAKVPGQPAEFPVPTSRPMRLAPAGADQFHALFRIDDSVVYATYRRGAWTATARLGELGTPSVFLLDHASVQLASDGRRQAFAVWPKKDGVLAGRWIRLQ